MTFDNGIKLTPSFMCKTPSRFTMFACCSAFSICSSGKVCGLYSKVDVLMLVFASALTRNALGWPAACTLANVSSAAGLL